LRDTLTPRRSEYIARNIRVTPFYFEPVARYYHRDPAIWSTYCYATDYPYVNGGKDSRKVLADALESIPTEAREQFFGRNGELLLPA
jgi:hypothetical protein